MLDNLRVLGLAKDCEKVIKWTERSAAEFHLLEPEHVAKRWGNPKEPTGHELRQAGKVDYHYKGVIQKAPGSSTVNRSLAYLARTRLQAGLRRQQRRIRMSSRIIGQ